MFHLPHLITDPLMTGEPAGPPSGRSRAGRAGRFAAVAAAALTAGAGLFVVAQPAQAVTNLDGTWTVTHGGWGQITLNPDRTYTSTCVPMPGWAAAHCPGMSGTFLKGTDWVQFTGDDGSFSSFRLGGSVYSPDIMFTNGRDSYSGTELTRGNVFVCTDWSDSTLNFTRWSQSMVYLDKSGSNAFATGSGQSLGVRSISNVVNLAETAPNYFQKGTCAVLDPTPVPTPAPTTPTPTPTATPVVTVHIGDLDDVSASASLSTARRSKTASKTWTPKVRATVLDGNQVPVSDVLVSGGLDTQSGWAFCTTGQDGTCTIAADPVSRRIATATWTDAYVIKDGTYYHPEQNVDPDGDSTGTAIVLHRP